MMGHGLTADIRLQREAVHFLARIEASLLGAVTCGS